MLIPLVLSQFSTYKVATHTLSSIDRLSEFDQVIDR